MQIEKRVQVGSLQYSVRYVVGCSTEEGEDVGRFQYLSHTPSGNGALLLIRRQELLPE